MQTKRALLFIFASLFSLAAKALLEVPPDLDWKTLKTKHFEVIYNAKQQELGQLYATKLEEAHTLLQQYFASLPKKTVVIINDKTDVTNGYATRIPYPHIMAYPTLPGPQDSLADIGDWAFEFLAHEYTHILNFEPANGVMGPLRSLFGNIIAPNILLPTWWKEGLAVEMETRLSSNGRLRSFYQDAAIRAMVQDDTFDSFDIAQVNENLPTWPEGMRPYLFGSLMWSQIVSERGAKTIASLNERHGARVPYFITTPSLEYLEQTYEDQYIEMQKDIEKRVAVQFEVLKKTPLTPFVSPKNSFFSVASPNISPDGKHLAVITENDANSRTVKLLNRATNEQSFLEAQTTDTVEKLDEAFIPNSQHDGPPTGSIQRVSWFPQSDKIIYDKIDSTNRYQRFSDLYIYDLNSKSTTQLTKGLRGREPAIAPDGREVVFVKLSGGYTALAITTIDSPEKSMQVLFSGAPQERISYPLYWDQETILFSLRRDGKDQLIQYSKTTKATQVLLPDFANIRFIKKTSEGLLFTSSKNGVLNLYLADAELKSARPITHSLTGYFTADLDPVLKEIFVTQMTSNGLKVVMIKATDWRNTPLQLPTIEPLLADRYSTKSISSEDANSIKETLAEAKTEEYSALGYLWPQYWMPFIYASSNDQGVIFSAQTSGFDPLKKHSYSLLGAWDTGLKSGSVNGSYLNQVTSLPFALSSFRRSSYIGVITNEVIDFSASASVLPDMFWLSRYIALQGGWQYLVKDTANTSVKRTGPYAFLNYANYSQSGVQVSPESGGAAYLGAFNYIEKEGFLSHSQFVLGGEIYFSKFLPKNHAVMFQLNAAYSPEIINSIYGVATDSQISTLENALPQYLLRGYLRGQLLGRNLASANFEYRFPLMKIYSGSGTTPLFLKRLSGAIVADAAAADGHFYNSTTKSYEVRNMKQTLSSAGAEVKLDTTVGYVLPISLVFGYYVAFNMPKGAEGIAATTLQISGF